MGNKTVLKMDDTGKMTPGIISIDKKDTGNLMPEKPSEKKQRKRMKKSSALLAASMERSAVDAVEPYSSKEIRGSSGLANTGTIISYD